MDRQYVIASQVWLELGGLALSIPILLAPRGSPLEASRPRLVLRAVCMKQSTFPGPWREAQELHRATVEVISFMQRATDGVCDVFSMD